MRDAFLLDPDIVFLDHGSFGACPRPVFEAYQHWQLGLERNPVAFLGRRSAALLAAARQGTRDLAAFLVVLARNGLAAIAPDEAFAQMGAIPVRTSDAAALREWLFGRHRIEVPVTQHAGRSFVRVSVQAYNTEADLAALQAALAEAGV